MTDLSNEALIGRLRAGARGMNSRQASLELLIAHGMWLQNDDFVQACIYDYPDSEMAIIAWEKVPSYLRKFSSWVPADSMLCIATELTGFRSDHSFALLVLGLDRRNVGLVLDAVAHLAGWSEHGITHVVTGVVDVGQS